MTLETKLGKIQSVYVGIGGYNDSQFGIHFTLSGDTWGVGDSHGYWNYNIVPDSDGYAWKEGDRKGWADELNRYIHGLLRDAKVGDVEELQGKPIEITFEGNKLVSWRILKEVL